MFALIIRCRVKGRSKEAKKKISINLLCVQNKKMLLAVVDGILYQDFKSLAIIHDSLIFSLKLLYINNVHNEHI